MARRTSILIVGDDAGARASHAKLLRLEGYGAFEAPGAAGAMELLGARGDIDVVLIDLEMPAMDGMALLREIKLLNDSIQVVLMTSYGTIRGAVEAMVLGAADYITKPFHTDELLSTLGRIVQLGDRREEVSRLRSELREKYRFDDIVGSSSRMWSVFERIEAARNTASTVLVFGESGTGKELVARAIHSHGLRAAHPFLPVNCAAIPRDLIESELFGHKRGAFTGATEDCPGLFRAAEGGTIFLDEIADMPTGTQAKLLRALQERSIRSIGAIEETPVNVRVIASTNQVLEEAIRRNRFREDLYYRLAVIRIELPPLRERMDDVPALVQHFIAKFNKASQRQVKGIGRDALEALGRYRWPGNVRELEGVIESAFAMGKSEAIRKADLPAHIVNPCHAGLRPVGKTGQDVPTVVQAERELLVRAMEAADGNKTVAARILGVSRPRLYKMIVRSRAEDVAKLQ
jgi:DNA-binding NtrC family response regulator